MVDPAGTRWPSDEAVPGLALLAAEFGCSRLMQLSKTDLFDPGPAPLSGPGHDPVASDASLRAALENERANAEDLRRLIRQQRSQLRRTIVRVALAIDDRGARLAQELGVRQRRASRRASKLGLIVNALPGRGQLVHRRRDLAESMKRVVDPPPFARRVSIIIVTDQALTRIPPVTPGIEIEWVIAATGPRAAAPPGVSAVVVRCDHKTVTAAAASGAAKAKGRVLCFMADTSVPLDPDWLARLGAAIGDDVLAATPLLVHPERAVSAATPFDLRVRELGLDVVAAGPLGSGGRGPPGRHAGPPGPTRERGRRRLRRLPGGGSGRVRRSRRPGLHRRLRRRGGGPVRPAPGRRRQGGGRALGGGPRSPPGPLGARPVPPDRSRQPGLAPGRGPSGPDVAGAGPGRPGHRAPALRPDRGRAVHAGRHGVGRLAPGPGHGPRPAARGALGAPADLGHGRRPGGALLRRPHRDARPPPGGSARRASATCSG